MRDRKGKGKAGQGIKGKGKAQNSLFAPDLTRNYA